MPLVFDEKTSRLRGKRDTHPELRKCNLLGIIEM
jgi:hypothetical protein